MIFAKKKKKKNQTTWCHALWRREEINVDTQTAAWQTSLQVLYKQQWAQLKPRSDNDVQFQRKHLGQTYKNQLTNQNCRQHEIEPQPCSCPHKSESAYFQKLVIFMSLNSPDARHTFLIKPKPVCVSAVGIQQCGSSWFYSNNVTSETNYRCSKTVDIKTTNTKQQLCYWSFKFLCLTCLMADVWCHNILPVEVWDPHTLPSGLQRKSFWCPCIDSDNMSAFVKVLTHTRARTHTRVRAHTTTCIIQYLLSNSMVINMY